MNQPNCCLIKRKCVCGGIVEVRDNSTAISQPDTFWVECRDCRRVGMYADTPEKAIENWNGGEDGR